MLEILTLGGLASRKVEVLLVYLACTGRPHSREALAGLLWEGRSQERAQGNLRVALTSLRKHLGDHVTITRQIVAPGPEAGIRVDALEFEGWSQSSPRLPWSATGVSFWRAPTCATPRTWSSRGQRAGFRCW